MKKQNQKFYNNRDVARELKKAIYKTILKNIKNKQLSQEIVDDILDPDDEASVDPNQIPAQKRHVMYKNKTKGIKKLKKFINKRKKCKKGEPIPGLFNTGG